MSLWKWPPAWSCCPGECTIKAISSTWNKDFGKTKVAVDLTMALSAAALGFFLYGALTGVREGTLISALLVGFIARWINQHLGSWAPGSPKRRCQRISRHLRLSK